MATTYSAFFSSGLLAPRHVYTNGDSVFSYFDTPSSPSPSTPVEDSSDIEVDTDASDRCTTPTNAAFRIPPPTSPQSTDNQPRLRKRRSSTSLAVSPLLNAIKSPSGKLKARSRSGSVNTAANIASQSTSLMGRLRSSTISAGGPRPKRTLRRLPAGPALPAPAGPLPEVPKLKLSVPTMRMPLAERSPREHQGMFGHQFHQATIDEEMKEN